MIIKRDKVCKLHKTEQGLSKRYSLLLMLLLVPCELDMGFGLGPAGVRGVDLALS